MKPSYLQQSSANTPSKSIAMPTNTSKNPKSLTPSKALPQTLQLSTHLSWTNQDSHRLNKTLMLKINRFPPSLPNSKQLPLLKSTCSRNRVLARFTSAKQELLWQTAPLLL